MLNRKGGAMKRCIFGRVVLAIVAAYGGGTASADLFSVDTTLKSLVRIDPTTGNVTVVGSLGMSDVTDIDLTNHQGHLYGMKSFFNQEVIVFEINPLTGEASSPLTLKLGLDNVKGAEGLASTGDELVVAFGSFI